jgi:hypothetical protein
MQRNAITDDLLEDHLKCNMKAYQRLHHGQSGHTHDYLAMSAQLDARYRANASQWLTSQSTTGGVSRFDGLRLHNIATADAIILDAVGVANEFETHFHALQRAPGNSHLGPYHYQPIRFCRHPQPNPSVHLLLAFDAFILGHLQGVSPNVGILCCGPTFKRINIHLRRHLDSLPAILTRRPVSAGGLGSR